MADSTHLTAVTVARGRIDMPGIVALESATEWIKDEERRTLRGTKGRDHPGVERGVSGLGDNSYDRLSVV